MGGGEARSLVVDLAAAAVSVVSGVGVVVLAALGRPIPVELGLVTASAAAFLFGRVGR